MGPKLIPMSDGLTTLNSEHAGLVKRSNGYGTPAVRELQARASVAKERQSNTERRSLRRLNHVLSNDQMPRKNLPRGFHINIEV